MLLFNNKQRSCMHVVLEGDDDEPEEFYNLLKLRWTTFNPEARLKVYSVASGDMVKYHNSGGGKYDYDTLTPPDNCRILAEEIIPHKEYQEFIKTGKAPNETID